MLYERWEVLAGLCLVELFWLYLRPQKLFGKLWHNVVTSKDKAGKARLLVKLMTLAGLWLLFMVVVFNLPRDLAQHPGDIPIVMVLAALTALYLRSQVRQKKR